MNNDNTKQKNYNKFKTIAGITIVVAIIIILINLIASENELMQLSQIRTIENLRKV